MEKNFDIVKHIIGTSIVDDYRYEIDRLYSEKYELMRGQCFNILDIGKSSRDYYSLFRKDQIITSDINQYDGYPDVVDDICNTRLENDEYDGVICNSILEHVYDPKSAVENIYSIMKKDGVFIGFVPFIFPYHAPKDLKFQDFYRFSKDGLIYLFRQFEYVELYAIRGKLSSVFRLNNLWKRIIENKLGGKINRIVDLFVKNDIKQVSGYVVWARK